MITTKNIPAYLPEPWYLTAIDFATELYRELPKGHVLEGKLVMTIARRQDMDDFLFSIETSDFKYAIVHLTWAKETDIKWPITKLYKSWEEVYQNRILPDSLDFI